MFQKCSGGYAVITLLEYTQRSSKKYREVTGRPSHTQDVRRVELQPGASSSEWRDLCKLINLRGPKLRSRLIKYCYYIRLSPTSCQPIKGRE